MLKGLKLLAMALGAVWLAACGGTGSGTGVLNQTNVPGAPTSYTPGTLKWNPPFRIASVDAVTLLQQLGVTPAGAALLEITGEPVCGIDVYHLEFWTVGGAGEATLSSGALMVPTGVPANCHGPRPIVEYAHATKTDQGFNIAAVINTDGSFNTNNSEGALIAAMFAAQGYIVVAPNYAGYDISTLGYHPWLDAAQQSGEMMDILSAARAALPNTISAGSGILVPGTSDSGQLFLTGYSQGGHVAMATLRAMQAHGDTVTAAAPMSGPYALEAFMDAVSFGGVNVYSTIFYPLLANSYQHAYGNVDSSTNPIFSSYYPDAIRLLPSTTPIDTIIAEGLLPLTALFDSTTPVVPGEPLLTNLLSVPPNAVYPPPPKTPLAQLALFQAGFGSPYLISDNYRVSYVADAASNPDGVFQQPVPSPALAAKKPTQGLRQDTYLNDLRNDTKGDGGGWAPVVPTLMCGGDNDPTVFFGVNTETMAAYWSLLVQKGLVSVLDVDGKPSAPFKAIQVAFQANQAKELQGYVDAGLSAKAIAQMVAENYHTNVAPFCMLAARAFFANF